MDEFKSQWSPFKKAIDKMRPAIKWNCRARINGKSLDRIIIYINDVKEILSEFKFDTDYDSDDTVEDFDCDSDIVESIPC